MPHEYTPTCSLSETVHCMTEGNPLHHPYCKNAGKCAGHQRPLCEEMGVWRLTAAGGHAQQYACADTEHRDRIEAAMTTETDKPTITPYGKHRAAVTALGGNQP